MPRVLLVDDDIAEISAVKRVLARAGHQALLATNASDALATVGRPPPAALVVAATCEGGAALRRIAEDEVAGTLPLLVLGETDAAPPGAGQLSRPVDPGQLAERLAAMLGGAPAPQATPPAAPPADRRAAADALRTRAEELRRGAVTAGLPAARPAAPQAAAAKPAAARPAAPRPAATGAPARPAAAPEAKAPRAEAPGRRTPAPTPARPRLEALAPLQPAPPKPAAPPPAPAVEAETPFAFGDDTLGLGLGLELGADPAETAFSFGEERSAQGPETPVAFGALDETPALDAALAELEAPTATASPGLDLENDPGLEAILRRAEQAEARALEEQAHRAEQEAAVRAAAEEQARRAKQEAAARTAAEEQARRAKQEAAARAAAEEQARRAKQEAAARAAVEEQARRAEREAAARAAVEEQARRAEQEAAARAAAEETRRAGLAEASARSEREARESADRELTRLRRELEEARRGGEERARAAARAGEEEARRRADAEEEQLRAAIESAREEMEALRRKSGAEEAQLRAAIRSAHEELEELRRRGEEDARRRAEAEAEAARLGQEAEEARGALEAERRAVEAESARRARDAGEPGAAPPPLEVPIYRPPPAEPQPDPAQESARRRVAALRERSPADPAPPPAPEEPPRAAVRPPPAELRAGTLAELPAPRLLALAARAGLSGRLDLEGGAARSLYFDGGRVVGASSSAPGERVEELALRLGLVTRDQHRIVAASAAPLATRRAAILLLERGFLKPNELAPLVRRRTEEVVFGVFGDAGARFRWSAAEVPPDESTALERTTLQLAVEGVRRRWLAPELDAVLGGDATLLAPVASGPSPAELGLSADDRRVLAVADGLRTLDEIVAASPLDELSTRQLLAALVLVGALAVRTFQAGRPAHAAAAAIDLARVRDKLEQVRRADYFTVLGVGRLCTPHEVRDAYERLHAEFDPRRFQGVREEGLEERLDEIQRVVADARDVLADDRLRAEYLRGLGA